MRPFRKGGSALGRVRHATHQLRYSEGVIKSNAYKRGAMHAASERTVWGAPKGQPAGGATELKGSQDPEQEMDAGTPAARAIRSNLPVVQRSGDMSQDDASIELHGDTILSCVCTAIEHTGVHEKGE